MTVSDLSVALDPATVRRTTLPNGLRVLVRRDDSAPVVAIVTYVSAGYFDETDDVIGIAHVLEHMYFKGTTRRGVGEIAKETKAAGGYLNAGTIYDHTSYYTVLPSSGFERGLEIQADAYADSVIDAEELRKELEVIIQEAKRKADNPSAVTVETLYELLHDKHRMRRWRIGREPGLRALTRDDVHRFYRTYYQPSNTILAVAGDFDAAEMERMIAGRFGGWPAKAAPAVSVPEPDPYVVAEQEGDDDELAEPGSLAGDERAGRLVDPDEGVRTDAEKDLVGLDVGIDGAAAGAEEAAMHVIDEDDLPG